MAYKKYDPSKPDWDQPLITVINEWVHKGLSRQSIAAKCRIPYVQFLKILEDHEELRLAWEIGRAEHEGISVQARHAILTNEKENAGVRAKIARENLRAFEDHSPVSRAAKVQVEGSTVIYEFPSFTQEEIDEIVANKNNNNDSEDQTEDE